MIETDIAETASFVELQDELQEIQGDLLREAPAIEDWALGLCDGLRSLAIQDSIDGRLSQATETSSMNEIPDIEDGTLRLSDALRSFSMQDSIDRQLSPATSMDELLECQNVRKEIPDIEDGRFALFDGLWAIHSDDSIDGCCLSPVTEISCMNEFLDFLEDLMGEIPAIEDRTLTLLDHLCDFTIEDSMGRHLTPATETSSMTEFLEFHEKLLKEMLAIEDSKYTIYDRMCSSAIMASIDRRLGPVAKGDRAQKIDASTPNVPVELLA